MVTATEVKSLREKTGLGMMECKKALSESAGDEKKAIDILRKKGLETANKKASRATSEGLIGSYIHSNGRIGVLLEVNCETSFVAKNELFGQMMRDVSMHIAAMNPIAVNADEISADVVERERDIFKAQIKNKPEQVLDKIVDGKLKKFYAEQCLLHQAYAKDPNQTVEEYIQGIIQKTGENIKVKRFVRWELGE